MDMIPSEYLPLKRAPNFQGESTNTMEKSTRYTIFSTINRYINVGISSTEKSYMGEEGTYPCFITYNKQQSRFPRTK